MKTEFTKGKWHIRKGTTEIDIIGEYKSDKTIAVLPEKCFVSLDKMEANAKLIAAAPRMFYEIVMIAHKEGWAYLFNIIKDVTGVEYSWGDKRFERLVNQAKEYLK